MKSDRKEYFEIYNRKRYYKNKNEIFKILGSQCKRCGLEDLRVLQIDHVKGGGTQERKNKHSGYYQTILKTMKNKKIKYQILCANCNWIKRIKNKEA